MTINSNCELCGARTGITYHGSCKTTVLLAHVLVSGQVVCKFCLDEIMKKHIRAKLRGRKQQPKLEIIKFNYTEGDMIDEKEDDD